MSDTHCLSESDWEFLLGQISNRNVIPIVGPELVTVERAPGGPAVPLYRALAPKLAAALGLPSATALFDCVNQVACQHLLSGGEPDLIYLHVSKLLKDLEQSHQPPEALCDLASVTDFDLFISVTVDHFLAAAMEKTRPGFNRKVPGHVLAYNYTRPVDLPVALGPSVIYYLLGDLSTFPNFVAWEEDYLPFIHGLMQHQAQLPNLVRLLKDRYLLFLGTPFADWIVRFFLFVAKGVRFSEQKKTKIRAYLTDHPENIGEPLIFFFDKVVGTTKVIPGDPSAFARELARRWRTEYSRNDTDAEVFARMQTECPQDAVFISYSHKDHASVANLVRGLRALQVPVWVDKERLQAGENYEHSLESAVRVQCSFFLSVISEATESDSSRYVHTERRWAEQRHMDGFVFYIPVIVDQTAQPAKEPPKFAKINFERLSGGVVTTPFADRLRKLMEQFRIARQPRA